MAFIYWIHHKSHKDIFSEGYVGYTSKTVDFRYRQHLSEVNRDKVSYLYNAIRKYGEDIVVETILEGSNEYCLDVELKLRPKSKIGWNAGIGGENTMLGYKHSPESKSKMSKASPTRGKKLDPSYVEERANSRRLLKLTHSKEIKEKLSKARLNLNLKPWQNPAANFSVWSQALKIHNFVSINKLGQYKTESALGFNKHQLQVILKKLRSGWNPSKDTAYLLWLEQQKLELQDGT